MGEVYLTIIIPTYNRAEILIRCLDCLVGQSLSQERFEVIVVDDGSSDGTSEKVSEWSNEGKLTNFRYLKQENQGQGNARNNALKYAKGEVVMFIGDDMLTDEKCLKEHVKLHEEHPEPSVAALGLVLWHPDVKVTNFMEWLTCGKAGGTQFAYDLLEGKEKANFWFFYTANISLKKELLDKYMFDTDFHSYGWEDIELGYRLEKEQGLELYYIKSAVVYHHHEIDEASLRKRMRSIGRSAWIFHKKHPELGVVPGFWKRMAFRVMSFGPFLWLAKVFRRHFYYYALSKKYLLEGLREKK